MKTRWLAPLHGSLWLCECALLVVFRARLGNTLPMSLRMFGGRPVMTAHYAGTILLPAILYVTGLTVAALGVHWAATTFAARPVVFAPLVAKILHGVGVYLEVFAWLLLLYCFEHAAAGAVVLTGASLALLIFVLVVGLRWFSHPHALG